MKIVGLTGGIGSGKTTVAKMFEELGVPVYIADDEAKSLMNRSKVIRRKLIELFGKRAYIKSGLNRPYLSRKIFNDGSLLQKMNAIVHPKVGAHFRRWVKEQNSAYVIKEAAILFESGSYKECDWIITVYAPEAKRIQRVVRRDKKSDEEVKRVISNQMSEEQRQKMSDFVIENTDLTQTKKQVESVHRKILKKIT